MQKTIAALLITLAVSVMGIPLAYFVGQQSAASDVERRLTDERARARTEQQALIADLRDNLAPHRAAAVPAMAQPAVESPPPKGSEPPEKPAAAPAPRTEPAEPDPSPTAEIAALNLPAIPKEDFEAVTLGETYPAVARKFGRDGSPALTMEDESGSMTRQYVWEWARPEGGPGRITMRFVDGVLTEKDYRE
jgi:type II secretory pathway pseudopilin PulG